MTEYISACGINFEVRRNSKRKRVSIGRADTGTCYIAAPFYISAKELQTIVSEHAGPFIKNLEKKQKPTEHNYREGELFYYRGELYPLHFGEPFPGRPLEFDGAQFICHYRGAKNVLHDIFSSWYSNELLELVRKELPPLREKVYQGPLCVHIKYVKTLWGSCSAAGNMTLNVKLALVPQPLMEYVIIHELCHCYFMNHSAEFWAKVAEFCPDYAEKRARLKADGYKYIW